jgi:hypothetical protein
MCMRPSLSLVPQALSRNTSSFFTSSQKMFRPLSGTRLLASAGLQKSDSMLHQPVCFNITAKRRWGCPLLRSPCDDSPAVGDDVVLRRLCTLRVGRLLDSVAEGKNQDISGNSLISPPVNTQFPRGPEGETPGRSRPCAQGSFLLDPSSRGLMSRSGKSGALGNW